MTSGSEIGPLFVSISRGLSMGLLLPGVSACAAMGGKPVNVVISPATEEKEEEEQEEHISTTTDTVLMPGSPTDPALEVHREKKNSVLSSISTVLPAANDQTTTTNNNNKEDKSKVTKDTSKV